MRTGGEEESRALARGRKQHGVKPRQTIYNQIENPEHSMTDYAD